MWNGFPVLLVGTSDKNRKFFPIGLAVTSSETTADFAFIFESLKKSYTEEYPGEQYEPSVVVADCADAISSAVELEFTENVKRVHCWAHVIRNVDKKLCKVKEKHYRESIRADIVQLQLAKTEEEFDAASHLWLKKWENNENTADFVQYFNDEYIQKCSGWYEGRACGFPSTNNNLEAINNLLKTNAP